jgi:predicted phage baseplate assembly protein
MSLPWWLHAGRGARRRLVSGPGPLGLQPELTPGDPLSIQRDALGRAPAYAPEWSSRRADDAGVVFVRLFAELTASIVARLNRLPEKYFVESLTIGGVRKRAGSVAHAMVQFTAADSAPRSVLVPGGFRIAGSDTDTGELVTYETTRAVHVAPGTIKALLSEKGNAFIPLPDDGELPFFPFDERPRVGRALWIGLTSPIPPGPFVQIGIEVATPPGAPPPVAAGGLGVPATRPAMLLVWEVLDGAAFVEAEVVRDSTVSLARSGVVELKVPRQWRVGRPPGTTLDSLRWLRLRLAFGQFAAGPQLQAVRLNAVEAQAARTIRDEVLEPLPATPQGNMRMRVSQPPVLPGSIDVEVEEGTLERSLALSQAAAPLETNVQVAVEGGGVRWQEVEDLSIFGPDARVFVLDSEAGVLTFGDGRYGRALPEGFRHVMARRYLTPSPATAPAEPDSVKTLLASAPFLTGVTNARRGSGGTLTEPTASALRRGPQEIRARNRAVTVADYALMATKARGALVARAYAVGAFHPDLQGRPIPGVVTVFVVPPDRGEGPPTADEQTLGAVAAWLSVEAAPAGVRVVAAPARFVGIQIQASVVLDAVAADPSETVRLLLETIDRYLHPIEGGEGGAGWPFGGPLRYDALVRRMLQVRGVTAVPRLNIVADGRRLPACADFETPPHALLWPGGHELIPLEGEAV